MQPPEKVSPPPSFTGARIPGPNYEIPSPPPAPPARSDAPERPKPLLLMRIKPGIEISEKQRDKFLTMSEQVSRALNSGGGLILDDSIVEPLVLIYDGHVIRFDGYEEEDSPEISEGYKPDPPPTRPARRAEQDRETW